METLNETNVSKEYFTLIHDLVCLVKNAFTLSKD